MAQQAVFAGLKILRDCGVIIGISNLLFAKRFWNFKAFEDSEGERYRLDKSAIHRTVKYHNLYTVPDDVETGYLPPWCLPQNGDVVLGKVHEDYPTWLLLQNGRWIVASVAGVPIAHKLDATDKSEPKTFWA